MASLAVSRRVQIVSFRPHRSGALLGYVDVSFPYGLVLCDLPVFTGPRGKWVALPSKPQIDADGLAKRDLRGKVAYYPVGKWDSKALSDRFSDYIVTLLGRDYATELEGEAA